MKRGIDMKTFYIFFILFCLIGGIANADENYPAQVLAPANARYVFGQISKFGRDQYMLDTVSGRLWQIAEGKDKETLLQPVLYKNPDGTYSDNPSSGTGKPKSRK